VADIHFDYRIALKVAEYGVDCLRINPGNIGNNERTGVYANPDRNIIVTCAVDHHADTLVIADVAGIR
jgi:(E)-4-hydroxy-3-methylbut-2-enyl-diphosphate synthase